MTGGEASDPGSGPPDTRSAPEAPFASRLHRRLTLNSLSNLARYAVSLVLAFFLTPFVVTTLGDALYGFWIVLLSFVGYAGILELGVQPAVVRVVGQHRPDAARGKLDELLAAAFVFFIGVGAVAAVIFTFVLPVAVPLLARDAPAVLGSRLLYAVIGVDVLLMFLNIYFAGVLYGWQLYPAKNAVDIASWLVNAGLLVGFLDQGGLLFLAVAKTATDALALAATGVIIRRLLPDFRLHPRQVTRRSMVELLRFGGRLFVSASTTRIASYAHPLVISSRISTAATAFFSIPVRLVDYAREIGWSLAAGFMPAFSQLRAQNQDDLLRAVYLRYSRYILTATLPIFVLLLVYGREFIGLWIGPEYGEAARWPVLLVTAAALVENFQPLYWRLFIGVGRLDLPVAVSAAASLLSIGLGLVLAPSLGIAGPALAVFLTGVLAQGCFTVHAARYLETSGLKLMTAVCGRPLLAGTVLFGATLGLERWIGTQTLGAMALGAVISILAYVFLAGFLALDEGERRGLRGLAAKFLGRRRGPLFSRP